jgi:hypothetical protein
MAGHYVDRIVSMASKRVLAATVLIARKIPEFLSVDPSGAGILLKLQGEIFLITAAHLLNHETWGDLVIPGANNATVTLQGELCTSYLRSSEKSTVDFSILRLYPKMHKHLTIYHPIEESEIAMNHSPIQKDHYLLAGYPVRKIKKKAGEKTFQLNPFIFLTHGTTKKRYLNHGFDENSHILVQFQRKLQSFRDGSISNVGNPQGISGSGLYFIPEFTQTQIDQLQLSLIGIMIENHQDKGFMAAFKIDGVIEIIRHEFGLNTLTLPHTTTAVKLGNVFIGDYMEIADAAAIAKGIEPPKREEGVNCILRKVLPLQI